MLDTSRLAAAAILDWNAAELVQADARGIAV